MQGFERESFERSGAIQVNRAPMYNTTNKQEAPSLGDSLTEVVVAAADLATIKVRNELKALVDRISKQVPVGALLCMLLLPPLLVFAAYGLMFNALTLAYAALFTALFADTVSFLAHGTILVLGCVAGYLAHLRLRAFLKAIF